MPFRATNATRRPTLCVALSVKNREQHVLVVDRLEVASGKTRDMAKAMASLGLKSALVVVATADVSLERAARNLESVKVIQLPGLNVYDLLDYEHVVFTREALQGLEKRLGL